VLSVGGIVEIVPLFYLKNTLESDRHPQIVWQEAGTVPIVDVDANGKQQWNWKPGDGVRPYTALELAGRDIYQREGCYLCHSQMVRPMRDEVERYGHFSLAAESMYDHPFQWGSKRTGPDLARVGGRYSDDWHRLHLIDPRAVVPESNMPAYAFLERREINADVTPLKMRALQRLGDPYTDEQIEAAADEVRGMTEMDALIAYLQGLGTALAHWR